MSKRPRTSSPRRSSSPPSAFVPHFPPSKDDVQVPLETALLTIDHQEKTIKDMKSRIRELEKDLSSASKEASESSFIADETALRCIEATHSVASLEIFSMKLAQTKLQFSTEIKAKDRQLKEVQTRNKELEGTVEWLKKDQEEQATLMVELKERHEKFLQQVKEDHTKAMEEIQRDLEHSESERKQILAKYRSLQAKEIGSLDSSSSFILPSLTSPPAHPPLSSSFLSSPKSQSQKALEKRLQSQTELIESLQARLNSSSSNKRKYEEAQVEVTYLRKQNEKLPILQEKLRVLESQTQRAASIASQYAALKAKNEILENNIGQWENLIGNLEGYQSTTAVKEFISTQIVKITQLSNQVNELESKLKGVQSQKEGAEQMVKQTLLQVENLKSQLDQKEKAFNLLLCWEQLLTKERDGLKQILDTYNNEAMESSDGGDQRLKVLEETLLKRDDYIKQLEQQLSSGGGGGGPQSSVLPQPSSSSPDNSLLVEALQVENAKLGKHVDELCREVALLESRLGRGEFNPTKTKVLHLVVNPEREAMQATQGDQNNLADSAAIQKYQKENEALQALVKEEEIKQERLREAMKKTITDFRKVYFELFGYKVDFVEKRYRLRSVYAENKEDFLLFQANKDGQLELLSTPFANTLSSEIETLLVTCHSIPAFLSTVTLGLFEKKTWQA